MSGARHGRRRRMLQEEVLSASRDLSNSSEDRHGEPDGGGGRRYAFADGSLSAALAKRYFPNRLLVPLATATGSLAIVAALAGLHHWRVEIAASLGDAWLPVLSAAAPAALARWLASAAMLITAGLAVLVLAVRRRRVDDYRGRHRWWRLAAAAAVLLSADAATNLHQAFAATGVHLTGIELLPGGAEWWLVLGTALFGWTAVQVLRDVKESRLALTACSAAAFAGGVVVVAPLSTITGDAASSVALANLAQVGAYLLTVTTLVTYMRFLRHDAAAGVATKRQKSRPAEVKLAPQTVPAEADESEAGTKGPRARRASSAKARQPKPASAIEWTDGSDGPVDDYDDEVRPRKLSKSERKRLRKQKSQRRAA